MKKLQSVECECCHKKSGWKLIEAPDGWPVWCCVACKNWVQPDTMQRLRLKKKDNTKAGAE